MDYVFQSWRQQLVAQVKAQPRKAVALAILSTAMAVLWIRSLTGGAPAPAAASSVAAAAQKKQPLSAGPRTAPARSSAPQALRNWLKQPPPLVRRNLFAVKLEYFPSDGSRPAPVEDTSGNGFWDDLAKSLAAQADQEKARSILISNLRVQAARLTLQSIVMSNGSPKALVNETLVAEGDTIDGFRVVAIEPTRIIVEREGVRLEVLFRFN